MGVNMIGISRKDDFDHVIINPQNLHPL